MKSAFGSPSFEDVLVGDDVKKPAAVTFNVETFDGFKYEVKVNEKDDAGNYNLTLAVSAELKKEREAAPEETEEDKTKKDEEFAKELAELTKTLAEQKALVGHVYETRNFFVDSINKDRSELMKDDEDPAAAGGAAPPHGNLPPGLDLNNLPPGLDLNIPGLNGGGRAPAPTPPRPVTPPPAPKPTPEPPEAPTPKPATAPPAPKLPPKPAPAPSQPRIQRQSPSPLPNRQRSQPQRPSPLPSRQRSQRQRQSPPPNRQRLSQRRPPLLKEKLLSSDAPSPLRLNRS